ncbi:MAG: ROK family protein [Anaerovoracaceae bacterium]
MRISVFDIGGTFIKHGLFDGSTLSDVHQIPTEGHLGTEHLIAALTDILRQELQEKPLDGIGISTRGQVDTAAGRIIYDPPAVIPGYRGTCLRQKLQSALGRPDLSIVVENDGNCAALAENRAGAAQGFADCICVVFGTAIGGAILSDHQIYHGTGYSAGEFGMMQFPAGCGGSMYYENYASVAQLVQLVSAADPSLTDGRKIAAALEAAAVSDAVSDGADAWAQRAALGLSSLIHIFNPPCLVLGGGIMESPEIFRRVCRETQTLLAPGFETVQIRPAALGNQAGMLGAGYLALEAMQR